MKKLMMAVAVVAATVSANAALIKWGNTKTATSPSFVQGSEILGLDGETAINAANAKTWLLTATLFAVDGLGNETALKTLASTKDSAIVMTAGVLNGASIEYTFDKESSKGDALYVLLEMTVDDKAYTMKIDQGWTNTQTSDADPTLTLTWEAGAYGGLAGTETAGAKGAWQAVPEPTSGLLMLLGFAGLALRRRRA